MILTDIYIYMYLYFEGNGGSLPMKDKIFSSSVDETGARQNSS